MILLVNGTEIPVKQMTNYNGDRTKYVVNSFPGYSNLEAKVIVPDDYSLDHLRIRVGGKNYSIRIHDIIEGHKTFSFNLYNIVIQYFNDHADEKTQFIQSVEPVENSVSRVEIVIIDDNDIEYEYLIDFFQTTSLDELCNMTFHGGSGQDVYIYYLARNGEEQWEITIDDPTLEPVEEYVARDNDDILFKTKFEGPNDHSLITFEM